MCRFWILDFGLNTERDLLSGSVAFRCQGRISSSDQSGRYADRGWIGLLRRRPSYFPRPLGGEGGPPPAFSSVRQPTEPGEGVKTVAPHANLTPCIQVSADPLTHRLAVPPLPQGGEGRSSFSGAWHPTVASPPRGRGKKNFSRWTSLAYDRRNILWHGHLGHDLTRGGGRPCHKGQKYITL